MSSAATPKTPARQRCTLGAATSAGGVLHCRTRRNAEGVGGTGHDVGVVIREGLRDRGSLPRHP